MSTIKVWKGKSNETRLVLGSFLPHSACLTRYTDKNFHTSLNKMNSCPSFSLKTNILHREHSTRCFFLSLFKAKACKAATIKSSFFYQALTHFNQNHHQRNCFIRQLSKNNKSLYWSQNVVNLHTVKTKFLQRSCLFRPNNRQLDFLVYLNKDKKLLAKDIRFTNWANKRNESIVSFELFTKAKSIRTKTSFLYAIKSKYKHDQLLFAKQSIKSNHFYRLNLNSKLGYLYGTNVDKMSIISSDLSNLALSLQTYTFLKEKGIHKIGSLIPYSPQALLQLLDKNKGMFAELRRCLLLRVISGNA